MSAPSTNPLRRGCRERLAIYTIAMPVDQANGSTMVMFFLGLAVDVPPFCSRPCFILARKVCAKLGMFLHFVPVDRVSTFKEFVGRKRMFLCFYVSRNKPVDTLSEGVHRLVFKKHKNMKTYISRQKIHGKYSTPSTGTKCKNIVLHIPFVPR